ncbi:TIGR03084 family metal-binding protein [Lutimaribacter sp. EGI FJ00015]|uniref:TIGR03084 family metal-binding protein n=1 Tax=Lutimaribacter degradans TaxID=2945989 RepID=A0ACC6A0F6_9RHOB|nr:TIGR03084 family metal-binding protein [Lutimaribacter sp. EGI FJ00013]MCM2563555.1 TIGR03084 family metal-binding protein [Lutimaribacter sp. EGI FJ00013]MCO0614782.1 TIGR03084 family metal-binding protein [Lutimaribacter sp. EGI FJ00015]MCO0637451.1 TIGR03084 family metal-binding protein [Lutimaribacter sp. EGI FJ00014]
MTEAQDFLAESETLHSLLADLPEAGFDTTTQFKGWTIDDVLVHLHFWNRAADLSARDEPAFQRMIAPVVASFQRGEGMRGPENATIELRGPALREAWITHARDMAHRWAGMDPKARLPWAGPSMSARSSITARQMETWAHGFEVFDVLGQARTETDRIRNIVMLGVNTFGWSHKVHGLDVPAAMPALELTAPSGARWHFGDASAGRISGPAADFAAVVTQTRALADTALTVDGHGAQQWMAHAQCFAGPPNLPPAPGNRHRKAV